MLCLITDFVYFNPYIPGISWNYENLVTISQAQASFLEAKQHLGFLKEQSNPYAAYIAALRCTASGHKPLRRACLKNSPDLPSTP